MFKSCQTYFATCGFYIARHPWLQSAGYVKVGYSLSVENRLSTVTFKTCFTPQWSYFSVFECESGKEALLLEQSVLFVLSDRRVRHRELLECTEEEVNHVSLLVAKELNINFVHQKFPSYGHSATDSETLTSAEEATDSALPPPDDDEEVTRKRGPPLLTITKYTSKLEEIKKKMKLANLKKTDQNLLTDDNYTDEESDEYAWMDQEKDLPFSFGLEEDYSFKKLRPYQKDAVKKITLEMDRAGRAVCQMACRCGKTPVAFTIMRDILAAEKGAVLYLVPGLTLLRQTAKKLYDYGLTDVPMLLIGSDSTPLVLDRDSILVMTTDPLLIRGAIANHQKLVVVSTYHSSHLLKNLGRFALTVFDECHRVCGSRDETAFNTLLLQPPTGKRLFMTATPTYDTPLKMNEADVFGGIAYRYYLREGINAGYVNPFTLRIVLGPSLSDMNPYLYEAMRIVDKMLVFCRNIRHAKELYERLVRDSLPADVRPFSVLIAHSGMTNGSVATVMQQFSTAKRAVLLNVRLFQEGVEIPDLNAVFFAAPRFSSRDIIQSICRPLNKLEGKGKSYVFLPAVLNAAYPEDHPINLENYSTLIPFTDALMDEDPTLFEYMIDPERKEYDISVVGVRSLQLTSEKIRDFILPAIRRGVRYSTQNVDRLHRAARMPWKPIFSEMRRIVLECNRYPKTNDAWVVGQNSISMNLFYRFVRRGYQLHLDGERTYLQVYQIRELESLPLWRRYGLHGPYPWEECIATLERHLERHSTPPPLDVHKGGYIGLDATPYERLCGCLMHVNQSDGHASLTLAASKQRDMDRLCDKYSLKWRKRRNKAGAVRPNESTFITKSYVQFKFLFRNVARNPVFQKYLDIHFPGYPHKHERMENLKFLEEGKVPPRHMRKKKREKDKEGNVVVKRGRGRPRKVEQTVMCRVCRVHVPVAQYDTHLKSKQHLRKQGSVRL